MNSYFDRTPRSNTVLLPFRSILAVIFLLGAVSGHNFGCAAYRKVFTSEVGPPAPCAELVEESREFTWERHYLKALERLDEAAGQCGETMEIRLLRGDIFYTLELWQEAEAEFEEVLRQDPGNHQAVVHLWFIDAIEKGFNETIREALKKRALGYLEEDPEKPEVVYATVLGLEGARAVPEKTRVIEAYSHIVNDPFWREDLADIYFYDTLRTGDEDLLKRARFFRREFPRHRLRYNMAGRALSYLGNSGAEAVQTEARKILKKESRNRILNYLCAKAILDVDGGDLDLAEKYIKQAVKAAGKPDPADRYKYVDDATWDKLMARTRAQYYAIFGRIYFLKGRNSKALKLFKEGLTHDARGHDLHLWYAEALEKEDYLDEALRHYRMAAELADSEAAVDGMQRLLRLQGLDVDPSEHFAVLEGVSRFTDVTNEAGLQGCTGRRVAWSDMNRDGFPDLVITGRHVFENNGGGTFKDVTESAGIIHEHASGGILADFDNNGLPDLFAFTGSNGPRLYLNKTEQGGPIIMDDVTETALPEWPRDGGPTEAAAAADVDGDGAVDIYLANYEKNGPGRAMCGSDLLYLNLGDGKLEDATSRVEYSSQEQMCGRGASFADFNGNGRPDLFVANYRLDPDFLLVNNPGNEADGFMLVDGAAELRVKGRNVRGSYGHSIGGAWGYLGKDGPALFVASLAHPELLGLSDTSVLYLPSPVSEGFDPHFEDLGFAYQESHSDPSFADVDLDGDLDLFITSVYPDAPSFLYLNQAGMFVDVTWMAGARVGNGWGAAWADYDKDGDMDLLVCSDGAPRLLRNEAQRLERNWLEVKAVGSHSPRTGIGAKVTVQAIDGEGLWVREIRAGRGTGNQDDAVAHFGLGGNKGPFKVTVWFPSGTEVVLDEVFCCDIIEVDERDSSCEKRGQETYLSIKTTLKNSGGTLDYDTLVNVYNSIVQSQYKIPHMDQLLNSLINKRNDNPRVDQMILIFSARALGNSRFPVPDACGIFESILRMDDSRVNEWVISFVAGAIGDYAFDIPDGDRLVDLLEERLDQVESADAGSEEYFGSHFLPPPQSDFIRSYISGINELRNREVERMYYYLLIQNNINENEIEAALRHVHSNGIPGTGEKCLLPMKYLLLNKP